MHPYRRPAAYAPATIASCLLVVALAIGLPRIAESQSEGAPPSATSSGQAAELETAFVEGYASALLEQVYELRRFRLDFEAPLLEIRFDDDSDPPAEKLANSLFELRGVERVRILIGDRTVVDEMRPETESDASVATTGEGGPLKEDAAAGGRYRIFPANEMFEPLIADPRWPRFAASYQQFLGDPELTGVGAASFGETFPIVRSPDHAWGRWEIAFQAGVFSVFDLDSDSSDLVNTDFMAGLSASHHLGSFTTMVRVYHQSSHLGDEFLLRNPIDRVNLSFEVFDALVSFDPWRWLRLYGGGGLLVAREPALERGLIQGGIEITSPVALVSGYLRPIAGLDVQSRQESDWDPDFSLRAGVRLEHPALEDRQLRFLGEFYDGRSPNGQFFERDIQTIGVGLSLGF